MARSYKEVPVLADSRASSLLRRAGYSSLLHCKLPEKHPRTPNAPFRRPSGIGVSGVERQGCRESHDGPGTARRGVPLKLRWSEAGPGCWGKPFGYFSASGKVTRPRGRNTESARTPKRRNTPEANAANLKYPSKRKRWPCRRIAGMARSYRAPLARRPPRFYEQQKAARRRPLLQLDGGISPRRYHS